MNPESRAIEIQMQVYRGMTGAQRLLIALQMSDFVWKLAISRLRGERPEWSDAELRVTLLRSLFGASILPERSP